MSDSVPNKQKSKFAITISNEDLGVEHEPEYFTVQNESNSLSVNFNLHKPRSSLFANSKKLKILPVEIVKYVRVEEYKEGCPTQPPIKLPNLHRSAVFPAELKKTNKNKAKKHSCTESCSVI